jgi:hypothetical protein
VDAIDPDEADREFGVGVDDDGDGGDDPHPHVISVRQRRDYRVPSVAALIHTAEVARSGATHEEDDEESEPIESVSEAILELLQAGDGSLGALDIPELEPLDGIVAVAEVGDALDLEAYEETDGAGPFEMAEGDRLVGRLDEHPYTGHEEYEDEEDAEEEEDAELGRP